MKRLLLILLLFVSCIPVTIADGTVKIRLGHSGKDMENGCEEAIAFRIVVTPGVTRDTDHYLCQCTAFEMDVTFPVPYGMSKVEVWAVDRAGNVSPTPYEAGLYYRAGYDSTFSVLYDSNGVFIFDRVLPNTVRFQTVFAEMAWLDEDIWHDYIPIPSEITIELIRELTEHETNKVHVRMNALRGDKYYPTKKRVIQLEPLWIGECQW